MVSSEGNLENLKTVGDSVVLLDRNTGWSRDYISYTKVSEQEANDFETIKECTHSCKLCGKKLNLKKSEGGGSICDYTFYCRNCNFRVDMSFYNYIDSYY